MNEKELATVLAALRHWQDECDSFKFSDDVHLLTSGEIDGLCERLNIYESCCRDHDLQANDGLDACLCCGEDIG